MAYSDDIKEVGFSLYIADKSFEEIAAKLGTTRKTVSRWYKKHAWEARRDKIREETRQKLDKKRADLLTRVILDAQELQQDLFEALKREASRKVPYASGVTAWMALSKFATDMLRQQRKAKWGGKAEDTINMILKVFSQDEVIGPILEKRKEEVINAIEKEFGKADS